MTWAKVDDTLHAHRKVRLAGLEAMGLWLVALSYCAQHLTDGVLTLAEVVHLAGARKRADKLAAALVAAGLWDPTDTGWTFHDWEHYQPTRAAVLFERARKVEAGRRGGQASAQARAQAPASASSEAPATAPATASGEAPARAPGQADGEAHARARARSRPARPSRPSDGALQARPEPDPEAPAESPEETAKRLADLLKKVGS